MEKCFDKPSIVMIDEHCGERNSSNSEIIVSIARRTLKYKSPMLVITAVLNAELFLVQSIKNNS